MNLELQVVSSPSPYRIEARSVFEPSSFPVMKDQKTFLEIKKRGIEHISQTLSEEVLLPLEIC